jgi:nitrate reductase delta subunit
VIAFKLLSLLLQYPNERLIEARGEIAAAASSLPEGEQKDGILRFLDHFLGASPGALEREYVATFDFNKRASLHLSFFEYGDRRQRGMAMIDLKRRYAAAGLPLADGELPDYLPAALEFTSLEPELGLTLLDELRTALELIRVVLHEDSSPYAHLLDAVCCALPALTAEQRSEIGKRAGEGPPTELVGLEPFGAEPFAPPEVMPAPAGGRS